MFQINDILEKYWWVWWQGKSLPTPKLQINESENPKWVRVTNHIEILIFSHIIRNVKGKIHIKKNEKIDHKEGKSSITYHKEKKYSIHRSQRNQMQIKDRILYMQKKKPSHLRCLNPLLNNTMYNVWHKMLHNVVIDIVKLM